MLGGYGLGTFSCVRRLGRIGQGGVLLLFWISSFGLDLSVKVSELYSMDMKDIHEWVPVFFSYSSDLGFCSVRKRTILYILGSRGGFPRLYLLVRL